MSSMFDLFGGNVSTFAKSATFPEIGPIDMTPGTPKGFGGFQSGSSPLEINVPIGPNATNDVGNGSANFMTNMMGSNPETAEGGGTAPASGGGFLDSISEWFVRAVVVILGFIFVAVGLSMFKGQTITIKPP